MSDHTTLQDLLMRMKAAFPEAVTEELRHDDDGKPYYAYALKEEFVEQLRDMGLNTLDDNNRYELQFPGKRAAKAQVFSPSYKTLLADKAESKSFDSTGNLFIEGDNLDVLRLLQNSYGGKIKMIYIDPPYNTGSDGFIYEDDFSVLQKQYLQDIGVLDEEGVRQISELQDGLQGKFHSGWLAMMYPRLKLARDLLAKDGVIFISIDDNEQANLKLICDEIFGEENFLANLVWENREGGGSGDSKHFKVKHEYILVYAKSKEDASIAGVDIEDEDRYKLEDEHVEVRGKYQLVKLNSASIEYSESLDYPIKAPDGTDIHPTENGRRACWRWCESKVQWGIDNDFIVIKKSQKNGWTVYSKQYLKVDHENNPKERDKRQIAVIDKFSTTQSNRRIKELFGSVMFPYTKPFGLIKLLLKVAAPKDALVLDFFAGSATTGEAVMSMNKDDGGDRKFILVQRGEEIKREKKDTAAHDFCKEELNRPAKISEIAKERLRRAGDKILEGGATVDIGFRVFTTIESLLMSNDDKPFSESEKFELSLYKRDLSVDNFDSLINEALLHTGVTLDLPIAVHKAGKGYPYAIVDRRCYCVTKDLTQDIVHKIMEQHGKDFDILYYLSDCPAPTTSYTELESVIRLTGDEKKIKTLNFY